MAGPKGGDATLQQEQQQLQQGDGITWQPSNGFIDRLEVWQGVSCA
jgi:hypothetical protein